MADKKKLICALVIVAVIVVMAATWYVMYRRGTTLVAAQADGATVTLACPAAAAKVLWAEYTVPDKKKTDVTAALQKVFAAVPGAAFTASSAALGVAPAGGALSYRYRCPAASKQGFRPVPINECGSIMDDHYAVDMSYRNAAGTVVWDPYSTQSRVSLERYADSPEVATPPNPVTGIGRTAAVRKMEDRYRRGIELNRGADQYELQPGEPGYMEAVGDDATSLLTRVTRRSAPVAAGSPSCSLANTDIDSDFYTDGFYDAMVLKPKEMFGGLTEGLTSERDTVQNTLTASRTGLGSVRRDPRFEPGPQWRVPGGDASWAHGGHAGGPTSGGYGSAMFAPPANFSTQYVFGFGDPNTLHGTRRTAEVIIEEPSTWTR